MNNSMITNGAIQQQPIYYNGQSHVEIKDIMAPPDFYLFFNSIYFYICILKVKNKIK